MHDMDHKKNTHEKKKKKNNDNTGKERQQQFKVSKICMTSPSVWRMDGD